MALTIQLRCYTELNDCLPAPQRGIGVVHEMSPGTTVADLLSRLQVPLDRVDLILINHHPVGFEQPLQAGDRVAVYPVFEAFDISAVRRLPGRPLRRPRFLVDAALPGLVAGLCRLGMDAMAMEPGWLPGELAGVATREGRIVVTRDPQLAGRAGLSHCLLLHARDRDGQLRELLGRMHLDVVPDTSSR